jgi:hypothetical protein
MKIRKTSMLSKSRFLARLQCPLRLWYQCYRRYLATPVSPAQQAIFDCGHQVGRLATLEYLKMIDADTPAQEKKRIKNDLLDYCGQDTLAMVRIRQELLKRFDSQ